MPSNIEYTSWARKLTYRFPNLAFVGIQVNFWVAAMILYSFVTYMNTAYIGQLQTLVFSLSIEVILISSVSIGFMLGVLLGLLDLLLSKIGIQKLPFGLVILLRIIIYPFVVLVVIGFLRFFLADWINAHLPTDYSAFIDNQITWQYFYWSLLIYIAFMAAVISFINQMNSKFGPGVLIPLLMGRFRKPKEQHRFFMFIDLKDSTVHAEKLGHLAYSAMIRDCFSDLNQVLTGNNAEIYQYVGDEAVIIWPAEEGIRHLRCLSLFYDFKERLISRQGYYLKNYHFIPEFKAGLNLGIVTAVEVGNIKREIAYHGDTINTAARIQGMCNQFNQEFLISDSVKAVVPANNAQYTFNSLGKISLKGKEKAVELFGIEKDQL